MDKKRIAWCITGSGHYLKESIDLMLTLENVDLYLSKAGEEVLKWYDYDLSIFKKIKLKFSRMSQLVQPKLVYYTNQFTSLLLYLLLRLIQ